MSKLLQAVFAAIVFAACPLFAAVPIVTFHPKGATAKVTAGAETGWICWSREGVSVLHSFVHAVDSDGDGEVQATFGSLRANSGAGCAVVEIGSGDFVVANMDGSPGEHSSLPDGAIVRGTSGEATEIFLPNNGSSWLKMWVRPGGGVWAGFGPDRDGIYWNDFIHNRTSDMSGSAVPAGFAEGDLFLAVRAGHGFLIDEVDRFLSSNAPGVVRFVGSIGMTLTESVASTDTVPIYRLGGTSGTISVRARVVHPAIAPYDTLLTFAPGEVRKDVGPFTTVDDKIFSGERQAPIELYSPVGTSIDESFYGLIQINDDDLRPVLTLGSGLPASIDEPDAPLELSIPIRLSAVASVPVEVQYGVRRDPSAPGWSDITEFVTIAPGQTAATPTVTIPTNGTAEADYRYVISVAIGAESVAVQGFPISATISVTDDDLPQIAIDDQTISEAAGRVHVPLAGIPFLKPSSTYTWATVDGTAVAGVDYQAATGVRDQSILITLLNDALVEGSETFYIELRNLANVIAPRQRVAITIADDESKPIISVLPMTIDEGASGTRTTANVTFELSAPSALPIQIVYSANAGTATAGVDYEAVPLGTTVIPAGATIGTVEVVILGDDVEEQDEQILFMLSNASDSTIGQNSATITIIDDDTTTLSYLSIFDATVTEGTGGNSTALFRVDLSAPFSSELRVGYTTSDSSATAGEDYRTTQGTIVFAPGEQKKFIEVVVHGDAISEGTELFSVTLLPPAAVPFGRQVAQGRILDDDQVVQPPLPTVTIGDVKVKEGDSGWKSIALTLTLSQPLTGPVQIDTRTFAASATTDVDFESNVSTITIPAEQTTGTVIIRIAGDRLQENDETFEVRITGVSTGLAIADDRAVITIEDDDAPAGRRRSVRH